MPILDDLTSGLQNLYGAGGVGDPLISIGAGLLSRRGMGPALAQGFQNAATMSQLSTARNRQAALDKLAQERESRQAAWQQWQQKHQLDLDAQNQANHLQNFGLQQEQLKLAQQNAARPPEAVRQALWISEHPQEAAAGGLGVGNIHRDVEARGAELERLGLDPKDPRNVQYRLTGKFPREDAQPLTPTDKKAILEADEGVSSAKSAIGAMEQAKKLSPQAYGGVLGSLRGNIGANVPDYLVPDFIASPQSGEATQNLENLVGQNALSQLKAIFGGNPTEGERAILLDLQGSAGKSDKVRQDIYNRAIDLAKKRLEFNQKRAEELRGGTFYAPKTAPAAQPEVPAPSISYPSWSIEK